MKALGGNLADEPSGFNALPDDLFDGAHVLGGLPDGRDLHAIIHSYHVAPRPNVARAQSGAPAVLISGPRCFVVVFKDGRREPYGCPLDAHDRMNALHSGALHVEHSPAGLITAKPDPFTYRAIWNLRVEPAWRSR